MDRQQIVEKLLLPLDLTLGAALELLRAGDAFEQASNATYWSLRTILRTQFLIRNELEMEGVDNIPTVADLYSRRITRVGSIYRFSDQPARVASILSPSPNFATGR